MLFGSSGIRRRFDRSFPLLSVRIGAALGGVAPRVLLGTDTRTTGPILAGGIRSGILSTGGAVHECGVVPTPAVGFCARNYDAGCMITASHNPEEYNGVKVFNPDGSSFSPPQQARLEGMISAAPAWSGWEDQGEIAEYNAIPPYIAAILSARRVNPGLEFVVECANGAACGVTPTLLSALAVHVLPVNCNPAGRFTRPSEPLEEHLGHVPGMVRETGSKGAVVHDGDADRMMAFDSRGRFISGDCLLLLFARYLGARRVVTTADASMAIEEETEVRRTRVGDSFVSEALRSWGDFGGEPSGAWIFPAHSLCPDGPYAAALFCEIAGEWNIAEEIDGMPRYPILRESVPVGDPAHLLRTLGAKDPTEGIRVGGDRGWYLVRASGTEPKVRLTAEGRTAAEAREMLREGRKLIAKGKLP
ncbi:MAG: phosphopentomutase/phosphoglucosamine mutase [Methanoregulaceae archaeon]|nr:phosphopentomutase/phosphoglucosamine mutase [Methanoregulaceae archaeon]